MLSIFLAVILGSSTWAAQPIEVQGHRGCRALKSENSLPAFNFAIDQGVDVIEMDLAVTKDMQLVVSHNPQINPEICLDLRGHHMTSENAPWIHDLTLAEVQKYDCGSIPHPRFKTQVTTSDLAQGHMTYIPTLDEVFELVQKKEKNKDLPPGYIPVRFNIETKSFRDVAKDDHPVSPAQFARLWYDKVKQHGMLKRSIFQSFDYRTLIAVKGIDKSVVIAALSEDPSEDLVQTARQLSAEIISPMWNMPNVNEKTIAALHKRHTQIVPWTVNTPEGWDKLIVLGTDSIISDNPVALIAYLKEKGIPRLGTSVAKRHR